MSKIVAVFLLLFLALDVQAQTDTIVGKVHSLQSVEVLSEKDNTIAASVPVQQINSQRMLDLGITSIADALTHIAGITVRDYGGAGGMKTVSARGIGSRHTGVVYDGIALSDCQTGEIDLSRYSLDNVSLLKMVIGDGDDIYQPARNLSSSAYLVIDNIQPPVSDHHAHLKAGLTYGSWNTIIPSFYYGQSFSDKVSFSTIGEYTHSSNDYPFKLYNGDFVTTEYRHNSKINAAHIESNVLWKMTNRQSLSGKVYYYGNNRQLPGIVHLYTNENDENLHEQNAFMQMGYRNRINDRFSLQGNLKYNWAKSDYHNGNPGSGIVDSKYSQQEYYASVAMMYSPISWLAMDYSGDYFYNILNSNQSTYERPSRHSILQSLSAKVNSKRITLLVRALWSNYLNDIRQGAAGGNGHRLSPSASLSYRILPEEDLYVRAFWKSIFRMPTFNELYYYHIGTTSLKPEKTNQWNMGITYGKQIRKCNFQFTADAYINKVDDKIVAIPFNMFVWQMMNLAKVSVYGTDITANIRWSIIPEHVFEFTGNYSWQRAENQTNRNSEYYNNQIAYTPEHTFSGTITWHNPWANFSYTLDGMDERWTTNGHSEGTRIAGFVEMNASVWHTFSLHAKRLTARAAFMNLTDKQYDLVAHYPMPGRSWKISLMMEI